MPIKKTTKKETVETVSEIKEKKQQKGEANTNPKIPNPKTNQACNNQEKGQ